MEWTVGFKNERKYFKSVFQNLLKHSSTPKSAQVLVAKIQISLILFYFQILTCFILEIWDSVYLVFLSYKCHAKNGFCSLMQILEKPLLAFPTSQNSQEVHFCTLWVEKEICIPSSTEVESTGSTCGAASQTWSSI